MEVGVFILGQTTESAAVSFDGEQIAQPAIVAGEDELLAIGTPGRSGDAAQLQLDALDLLVAGHVDDDNDVAGSALGCEGEKLPVGGPVGLRVDETIGLVVAA